MKEENSGKIEIDLIPFIAKSIAQNPAARRELDSIYSDETIPIERALSPKLAGYNRYYRECDVLTETYCHKATAFILTALNEQESGKPALAALSQLLQKCWRQFYAYVAASGPAVPFAPFWSKLAKKGRKLTECEIGNLSGLPPGISPRDVTTSDTLNTDFPIFWFLVNLFGKTISVSEQDENFHKHIVFYQEAQERMHRSPARTPALTEPQKKLAAALWGYIKEQVKGIPINLDEYFCTQEYKQKTPVLPFKQEIFGDLPIQAIKHVNISRQELRTTIDLLAASLPAETTLTAELQQTALDYFRQVLLIRACAHYYETLRSFALEQGRLADKASSRPLQVAKLKEQLAQARQKIWELEALPVKANQNSSLEPLLAQKQQALNELQLRLEKSESTSQKEIARLQARLDEEQETNQVLTRLLAAAEEQPSNEEDLSPDLLAKIMLLRVVILGGRTDWQQRLKAKYPNFRLISPETVKFDLAILGAADVIVINRRFLGHSLFYRAVHYAGKYNKEVVYLNNNNEKHLLQALCRKCGAGTGSG
ncbi:hypothetical protein [Sporomusa termitida]|uniref:DUF2325 domain-containing protein n=1 Tax=Sporomusa termitida TaxID=2377 RepID=A0A517E1N9_9FIRM|nr:hypothetical protein [Sporomusa termitida]QDR83426.1 hypothetical protein SPTER_49170 [Sporomusa termitida]